MLERGSAGYRLAADAVEVDVDGFDALARDARSALADGAAADAESLLTAALALVRGRPLEGLEELAAVRSERERLIELQLLLEEDLVEARLEQGRHRELVPELGTGGGDPRARTLVGTADAGPLPL